jgi:Fur family ferric uptake transcriptional regulator
MIDYKKILHDADLKITPARISVLSFLEHTNQPLAVDTIFDHLKDEHDEADRATIYRIVETFALKGIVKRLELNEGKYRYELAGEDHHHLICEVCGRIEDISDCNIEALEKDIKKRKNFLVKKHSLEFFGVCQLCQQ